MADAQIGTTSSENPLRLWPGVVAVVLQWLLWFVAPIVLPGAAVLGVLGGLAGGLVVLLWWLFFSRARWFERVGAIALMVVALFATKRLVHPSIANGMMGMMLPIYSIPLLSLALVAGAAAGRYRSGRRRHASLLITILLACGVTTLMRTGGITADAVSDLHWRWTKTPEEQLLAQATQAPSAPRPSPPAAGAAEASTNGSWSGFRGPARDGLVRGLQIATNWSRSAPVELWRRPVGPGWSSCAVSGTSCFTQEQRGEDELVSCYDLTTGAPVWSHRNAARFWESNAGPGPRGTPTVSNGRVYTLGATGILNALSARDGSVFWSRHAASDTAKKIPAWGFASSPLILGDLVVIATGGVLAAYDLGSGNPRWFGPTNGWGYSSPHLATIAGVPQIVLLNGAGAISVATADGKLLWKHPWQSDGIVQPAMLPDGDVLIGSGSGLGVKTGLRRVAVAHEPTGWRVEERWTSAGLKPYFNDFVVLAGHAYGFDGSLLACLELTEGKRQWKDGRYGAGQLVGLVDQGLLLVLGEQGTLALVKATPDEFKELARLPAIKGKTWNHPAVAGDVLLVRNDQEMAAFRLPLAGR